jgi:Rad3-related DNA helicase
MVGRAVRSNTDYATTFVLDSQFEQFVTRNEDLLPDWWRAAIQTGRQPVPEKGASRGQ